MRLRAGSSPARVGGGVTVGGVAQWAPWMTGALVLEALAENATLSGSNITALANPRGSTGALATGSTSCTLYSSVQVGGKNAIRTSSTSSDLHVASGGPTGNSAFSVYTLAWPVAQLGAGQNDSTFITLGNPGNDSTHKVYGIGYTVAANGAWMQVAGFQNATLAGNSTRPLAAYDGKIRLFELVSTGATVSFGGDGGLFASAAIAVTLDNSGRVGFSGPYPLASFGPPDTRVYGTWVFNRALTASERARFLAYAARKFTYTPAPFFSALGDSKTAGHIVAANTTSYGELMVSQYASAGSTIYVKNDGVTSQTTTQIRARAEAAGFFDYFAPRGFRRQFMIIRGRTNDPGAGLTPAQSYANIAAISVLAQSYGIKTIVSTEFGTTGYVQADRDLLATYNGLVMANSCGADAVADVRSNVSGGTTGNPTAGELPDGTHQSDAVLALDAAVNITAANSIP